MIFFYLKWRSPMWVPADEVDLETGRMSYPVESHDATTVVDEGRSTNGSDPSRPGSMPKRIGGKILGVFTGDGAV